MLYVTHSASEALALGSRLFLLDAGCVVAQGTPLDVFSKNGDLPARSETWQGVRNVFPARIANHDLALGSSSLALEGGPSLTVPSFDRPVGTRVLVAIRADDILLALEPLVGSSARNQLAGEVDRLVRHKPEAEVIVRTGELTWIVSVVEQAIEQLALFPGARVHLIVKARSCHILGLDSNSETE
jgi:molybdate transport system ATP-binding protein